MASAPGHREMSMSPMEPKRILVVEDDSAIRRGILDALQFTGYETLQAANGNDGLRQALQATFDLLLLDLVLPGRSGFENLCCYPQAPASCRLSGNSSYAAFCHFHSPPAWRWIGIWAGWVSKIIPATR